MIDIIELRHSLHRIPELAFQEFKTKAMWKKTFCVFYKTSRKIWHLHYFQNSPGLLLEYSPAKGNYLLFRADMDEATYNRKNRSSFCFGTS